jgi:uncharacterized protein YcnI
MKRGLVVAAASLALMVPMSSALAHVTMQPNEAIAGGFQAFVVQVPNERDDASTVKVEVEFPPLPSVSFQDVEGWDRKVEMVKFDEPIEAFGEEVTEGVGTVTWSGGSIEPGEFARFGVSIGPVPAGELEFKAIQTYSSGEVVRWIGPADADEPAPRVNGIELGVEEGQGQLGALADIKAELETLNAEAPAEDTSSTDNTPTLLAGAALVVALIALFLSLRSKPSA